MTTITRQTLENSKQRRAEYYPVGDGQQVRLQSLTETERADFDTFAYDDDGKWSRDLAKLRRRKLIQLTMIGDDGKRQYEPTELDAMGTVDGGLTETIYQAAVKHTRVFGLNEEEDDDQKKGSPESETVTDSALPTGSV